MVEVSFGSSGVTGTFPSINEHVIGTEYGVLS